METLKKYWYIVLGIIVAVPLIYKYYMSQISKIDDKAKELEIESDSKENALNQVEIQVKKADAVINTVNKGLTKEVRQRLSKAASDIAHGLGTTAGIGWSPYGWTENDEEVGKIIKYECRNLNLIAKLYQDVYTENRNMKNDLMKYLDSDVKDDYRKFVKKLKVAPFI